MSEIISQLKAIVGARGFLESPSDIAPFLVEGRGLYRGETPLVLMPATTAEAAAIVKLCAETHTRVVPQGGNTGLTGGQIPMAGEILLSTRRLNKIRALDAANNTVTVEAGCILADIQKAAAEADRLFPLSLAAEGSCTIGGNLATNAGGTGVLRYGTARDLALGLEVVLADGRVLDVNRALRKDTSGYDLKQMFIGAEGTLGLITAAALKLFARPRAVETAFVALARIEDAIALLARARADSGDQVSALELLPRIGLDFLARYRKVKLPFAMAHPWYALIELTSGEAGGGLRAALERTLDSGLAENMLADAVIADSETQRKTLWALREELPDVQKQVGASIKCDISVPVSAIADFCARATAAVTKQVPGIRPVPFGHVGDGNVHFNLSVPEGGDNARFLERWDEITDIVQDIAAVLGGSISAEHGVGQMKRTAITRYKSAVELDLMRALKKTLDPQGIMNPGKVI